MTIIEKEDTYVSGKSLYLYVSNKKTEVVFTTDTNRIYLAKDEFVEKYMTTEKGKKEVYRLLGFRKLSDYKYSATVEHTVYHQ